MLLRRRPPVGVWASLWSLPQFDQADERDAWLAARIEPDAAPVTMPAVEHTFSHYHLTLHPLAARIDAASGVSDDADLAWVDAASARTLGIPAPVRRLIESLFEE